MAFLPGSHERKVARGKGASDPNLMDDFRDGRTGLCGQVGVVEGPEPFPALGDAPVALFIALGKGGTYFAHRCIKGKKGKRGGFEEKIKGDEEEKQNPFFHTL
jgi:hypothetical protein